MERSSTRAVRHHPSSGHPDLAGHDRRPRASARSGSVVPAQASPSAPTSTVTSTSTAPPSPPPPPRPWCRCRRPRRRPPPPRLRPRRSLPPGPPPAPRGSPRSASKAVRVARAQLGDRYVAGRTGPNAFDCSGLARYVVKKALGRSLPHYSKAQFRVTKRVSKSNLRPGDLVFFFKRGAHHVGVYIGRGRMVNATNPRGGVKVDRVFSGWYGSRYSGAGRLV